MDEHYPAEWESDVVLTDGGTVHLRPIRPDDDAGLLGLFARLSRESIYMRFFSPVSAPTAQQLAHFTHVDYDNRMALVAELGEDIVAVARYDRPPDADDAEVAFTVQDDQQGRGLATIMLEHLAAVARTRGIRRFFAETLPDNRRMLGVFRDAGFQVVREFADGVVHVTFPIDPTEASQAVQDEREQISEARSVRRLLAPRSIAVIGAGRRPGTIGHELFRNLLAGDFTGPVYPVNPHATDVASVRAYPTVLDVPDAVDLAVITVPAAAVTDVVRECAEKSVHGLIVISAGFAERGSAEVEQQLVELARRHGMRLVGPNGMGVVNTDPDISMNATFAPFQPVRGQIGFASQSGALGIELLGQAASVGLGVSTFVSMGNKADVSGNDLLQYWDHDPETTVILLYLESFGNPRKFARLARRVGHNKPILAVKSGRSRAGTRAAASHTAALASSDVATDALFHQAGVVRVDTLAELLDTAQVLVHQPLPPGRRVAIVSNGGGPGILASDACEGASLEVPLLSDETQTELRSFVSPDASTANPIDLIAAATAATYERALRTVLADPGIDAVLVIFVPPLVTDSDDVARAIAAAASDAGPKPVVACFLTRANAPEILQAGADERRAIPCFTFPEAAAVALGRAASHAEWRRRPEGTVPDLAGIDRSVAHHLVADALEEAEDVWLNPEVAADLCRSFGIPVAPLRHADSADEAAKAAEELGFPVALKAGAGALVHKTDVGGVALGLDDADAVRAAYESMAAVLGPSLGGVVVQPMVEPGIETIVGVTQDPSFGPLVLFGMGGIGAELVRDTALRLVPLTDLDAADLVRSLRSSPLLFGYRGAAPADTAALEDLVLRVGMLADELPQVHELDCNPVVVGPDGVVAIDVKIRLARTPEHPSAEVRRLRSPT
ncbi:MAG: bifunctional acetate--CoA ligase family protein/GNAT family N-acetyltransferase [Acidimicrobiia bacterium]